MFYQLFLLLTVLLAVACEVQLNGRMGGKRTLVLLEDMDMRLSHSLYFDSLTSLSCLPLMNLMLFCFFILLFIARFLFLQTLVSS